MPTKRVYCPPGISRDLCQRTNYEDLTKNEATSDMVMGVLVKIIAHKQNHLFGAHDNHFVAPNEIKLDPKILPLAFDLSGCQGHPHSRKVMRTAPLRKVVIKPGYKLVSPTVIWNDWPQHTLTKTMVSATNSHCFKDQSSK